MVLFNEIYGHKWPIEKLLRAKARHRLPHALLLAGPEGVGKKKIAFALAQSLLCENQSLKTLAPHKVEPLSQTTSLDRSLESQPPACGQCPSCVSLQNQKNPHIMFIQPKGLYIKVDSIREIGRFMSLKSLAPARVVIMDSAHQMNLSSANSFLKILEEPPKRVYFFLISSSLSALPVTIRSRTQIVRFAPLSKEDTLLAWQNFFLKEQGPSPKTSINLQESQEEETKWLVEMSQGRLSTMEKWKENSTLRDQAFKLLRYIDPQQAPCSLEELTDLVRERQKALLVCSCWQKVFREVRIQKVTNSPSLLLQGQDFLIKLLTPLSTGLLDLLFEKTIQIEQDLKSHVDSRLVFDNFLFFSRHEIQKWSSQPQ